MSTLTKVSNMKEMRDTLETHLLNISDKKEEDEEKGNSVKIKTYIIESNIDNPQKLKKIPPGSSLLKTDDNKLFQVNYVKNNSRTQIYFDISDERFWLFHSFGESKIVENFVNSIVTYNNNQLDYSWFSSNFLENECSLGIGEGFNIKYNNSFLDLDNNLLDNSLKSFTMLFWGAKPKDVLSGLKDNSTLVSGVSLSKIKQVIKTDDGFVKENIGRNGKFTLWKGDSIDSHLWAVENIKEKYSDLIRFFEDNYRIRYYSTDSGLNIKGTYSLIRFNKKIENIEFFLSHLLTGNLPFRIFGFTQKINEKYFKVNAIDLHTNDKFNMEITPDFIRVYLYENSCGNIITRLMTNLQRYYDSQVELKGSDDERFL